MNKKYIKDYMWLNKIIYIEKGTFKFKRIKIKQDRIIIIEYRIDCINKTELNRWIRKYFNAKNSKFTILWKLKFK